MTLIFDFFLRGFLAFIIVFIFFVKETLAFDDTCCLAMNRFLLQLIVFVENFSNSQVQFVSFYHVCGVSTLRLDSFEIDVILLALLFLLSFTHTTRSIAILSSLVWLVLVGGSIFRLVLHNLSMLVNDELAPEPLVMHALLDEFNGRFSYCFGRRIRRQEGLWHIRRDRLVVLELRGWRLHLGRRRLGLLRGHVATLID